MKRLFILLFIAQILFSCSSTESKTNRNASTADNRSIIKKDSSTTMTDNEIDKLVQQASASGSSDDLTRLWKATLNLKQWHFVTKVQDNLQDRKPFIGVINNRPWVFVFTDRQKAQSYCLTPQNSGFVDKDGNTMVISMDTEKAIDYILNLEKKGVYGMRINEGNGWFSPIANLPAIIKFANKE